MAKARRAKARPARVVVPILLALLLIGGVGVGVGQGWFGGGAATTTATEPSVLATEQTASATSSSDSESASAEPSDSTSSSDTPSPSASSSSTKSSTGQGSGGQDAQATEALRKCRDKVEARERVLKAAATGVGHWSEHVQAQTDANQGDISSGEMQAIFKRTRLAGPADVRRYQEAVSQEDRLSGTCRAPSGAPKAVSTKMADCAERGQAQGPVLTAAKEAMNDWRSHLGDMKMSKMGHVNNPQAVWIKTWRAAPKDINAYRKAASSFDAPAC